MGWIAYFLDISLDRANQFYAWGWRASVIGAVITMLGVGFLWLGTRVRDHDFESQMKTLGSTTAHTLERAGALEVEAARLRLELDREIQKRAQRILTDEQRAILSGELQGKLTEIAVVTQNDPETFAFSVQIMGTFGAGIKIYGPEPPREDKWVGLVMYSPLGTHEDELKDDPLYRALVRASLFGGTMDKPYTSAQVRGPVPALIQGYSGRVLYIGGKSPF